MKVVKVVILAIKMNNYQYFKEEQKKVENLTEAYRIGANKQLAGLSKNLILVSTIFIALSSSVVGSSNIFTLEPQEKMLFLIGLGGLIISLFFGLIQFILDARFNRNWVVALSEIYKKIAIGSFENIKDYQDKAPELVNKLPLSSPIWPMTVQSIFLFLGVSDFVLFIYKFLF